MLLCCAQLPLALPLSLSCSIAVVVFNEIIIKTHYNVREKAGRTSFFILARRTSFRQATTTATATGLGGLATGAELVSPVAAPASVPAPAPAPVCMFDTRRRMTNADDAA